MGIEPMLMTRQGLLFRGREVVACWFTIVHGGSSSTKWQSAKTQDTYFNNHLYFGFLKDCLACLSLKI